jgi:hypothetical protein
MFMFIIMDKHNHMRVGAGVGVSANMDGDMDGDMDSVMGTADSVHRQTCSILPPTILRKMSP